MTPTDNPNTLHRPWLGERRRIFFPFPSKYKQDELWRFMECGMNKSNMFQKEFNAKRAEALEICFPLNTPFMK